MSLRKKIFFKCLLLLVFNIHIYAYAGDMFGPVINDITTTFPNPPQYVIIAKMHSDVDYSYKTDFLEKQKKAYPLAAVGLATDPDQSFEMLLKEIENKLGWEIVSADKNSRRIEAVATTAILRFKDDIVIEVRDSSEGSLSSVNTDKKDAAKSWVHMRSRSRLGKSDFGANAKRIRLFLEGISQL